MFLAMMIFFMGPEDRAWLPFSALDVQQAYVGDLVQGEDAPTLQALTGYPYVVEAIHALRS